MASKLSVAMQPVLKTNSTLFCAQHACCAALSLLEACKIGTVIVNVLYIIQILYY